MYATIDNIIGEKTIDLDYLIRGKEVVDVSVFSDNSQYEFTEPWTIEFELSNKPKKAGTYTRRELKDLIKGKIELTLFDKHQNRMNKQNE